MPRSARTFTLDADLQARLDAFAAENEGTLSDLLTARFAPGVPIEEPGAAPVLDEFGLVPEDYPALHAALGTFGSLKLDCTPTGIRAAVHRCRSQAQMDAYGAAITEAKSKNKEAVLAARRSNKAVQYAKLVAARKASSRFRLNASRVVELLLITGMDTLEKVGKDAVTIKSRGRESRNAEQATR